MLQFLYSLIVGARNGLWKDYPHEEMELLLDLVVEFRVQGKEVGRVFQLWL